MSKKAAANPAQPDSGGGDAMEIIELETGYGKIKTEGIDPFITFIEAQERLFFRAKEFVKLYDLIFKMCIQRDPYNWSDALYQRYTDAITRYLLDRSGPLLKKGVESGYDVALLKEWKQRWANHKLIVQGMSKLFMYLDRFYTPNTDGVLSLKDQGFKLYKEHVFDVYAPAARQAILNAIDRERGSEEQDRHLLQEAVTVFVEMGFHSNKKLDVYSRELEAEIVKHAGTYYQRRSRQWMDEDSTPNYLEKAERMLNAEKSRVESYLHRSTLEPLNKEVYTQMLKSHQDELLRKKTGLNHLLATNASEDLTRLYRLYKTDGGADLEPIANMFHEYVRQVGSDVVEKAKSGASGASSSEGGKEEQKDGEGAGGPPPVDSGHALVRDLIGLHQRYNDIVVECFEKAQIMQKALKRAFEDFINKDNRVSKLLAKFVNDVLKKGTKVNVKDFESTLDNIVFLYGYIQEKDIFERDYQIFLAHRLLNGLCESEHAEKSMIAKLKTECGYQWTNKLEGMFKDVQLSKEMMSEFRKLYQADDSGKDSDMDIQLDVNVCTTGYWPSSKAIPQLKHPKELNAICDKFKRFYLNKHSGHKLEWRLEQGQGEITVDFNEAQPAASRRGLVLSTYQMMIMLVFNSFKILTYKQILDMTGIPRYDIANHLLSLCHPKIAVLLKNPNTKKLEDNDKFKINSAYKNPLKKVTIPVLKGVDGGTQQDEETNNPQLEVQRRHQMDAAIVRIMKTRKTLRHNLLVAEVAQQLQARFRPKPNDIKKRIEALIEQEYLERDPEERGTYKYLA